MFGPSFQLGYFVAVASRIYQGTLNEGDGSVWLTSSLRQINKIKFVAGGFIREVLLKGKARYNIPTVLLKGKARYN